MKTPRFRRGALLPMKEALTTFTSIQARQDQLVQKLR